MLARIYGPTAFGLFASVLAVSSVFVGVSTLRLEVLAQRAASEEEARATFRLALISNLAWGSAISLVAVALVLAAGHRTWVTTGILVVLGSLQLIGSGVLIRRGDYHRLSQANFFQGAGGGLAQLALGMVSPGAGSLLAGFAVARFVWIRPVLQGVTGRASGLDAVETRRFALVAGSTALVNSLGGQAAILAASLLYGNAAAGLVAMAIRLLISPLSVIGQAAAAGALGEVGGLVRAGQSAVEQRVRRAMRDLALIGFIPCLAAATLAPMVVPRLFGPEWGATGTMVSLLSIGALAQLAVAPFAQLLNVLGRSRALLIWDLVRFGAVTTAWVVPWILGQPIEIAVASYSLTLILVYALLRRFLLIAARG